MKSVLISLLLLANIAFANTEIVKVEVEGFGDSLQSAIDRGLSEAMGRVNGRSIESEVVSKNSETLNVKNQTEDYFSSSEYQDQIKSNSKFSNYAWGEDYHDIIKSKLQYLFLELGVI